VHPAGKRSVDGADKVPPMERASAPGRRTTVEIACDEPLRTAGLRALLEAEGVAEVVAESSDVASAARMAAERRPQAAVIDVGIANGSGIEAVRRIRRAAPSTGVVVLARPREPSSARRAMEAGALAYLGPGAEPRELCEAIAAAGRGRRYQQEELERLLAADPAREPGDALSDREREVLRLLALGHTNREIARSLFLSVRTVESHRARLLRKLGARSRSDLVSYALQSGLIEMGAAKSTS